MLFVFILLALVVALYFLAPKKEPPPVPEHRSENASTENQPTPGKSTLTPTQESPFANTRFAGELIEPTDKRITKALAVKMYAQVIRQAWPGRPEKTYKSSAAYFAENISLYWAQLDQEVPTWEIDDLKENIEGLKDDLMLESEEEDEGQPDQERIDWLQEKIKLRSQELKQLKALAKKYKNRDLRFFLASELNSLIHGVEPDDTEVIAQKTDDFWKNKPKPSVTAFEDK